MTEKMMFPTLKVTLYILALLKVLLLQNAVASSSSFSSPASTPELQLVSAPRSLAHNTTLTVEYRCTAPHTFLLRVSVLPDPYSTAEIRAFEATWSCSGAQTSRLRKRVSVTLPARLAYRPGYRNPRYVYVHSAFIYTWAIKQDKWTDKKQRLASAELSSISSKMIAQFVPFPRPYERPEQPFVVCDSWWAQLQMHMHPYSPVCEEEKDTVHEGVSYPLMLSGRTMGVHRKLQPLSNQLLESERQVRRSGPKCTIELWLFIEEYCPYDYSDRCSILQRMSWDDFFNTPLLYITTEGQIRVTIVSDQSVSYREFSAFTVPRKEWVRLVFQLEYSQWTLTLNYGPELQYTRSHSYRLPPGVMPWYDDTQNLHIFGGSEMVRTFKGILGKATIYRGRSITPKNLPLPPKDHAMFTLEEAILRDACRPYTDFHEFFKYRGIRRDFRAQNKLEEVTCSNTVREEVFGRRRWKICHDFEGPLPKGYSKVKAMLEGYKVKVTSSQYLLGQQLFRLFLEHMRSDSLTTTIPKHLDLLRASSCYGNNDATFTLAAILDQGIVVEKNKHEALQLLMHGVKEKHRGCLMALGSKHALGTDLPQDIEQAYAYYQGVAESTEHDIDTSTEKEVAPDHVRLIDDEAIEEHTGMDGDLFLYYKFQAEQGELFALQEMARMLYWGMKGVQRNLTQAADYYKRAADTDDPSSLYDYGIILIKGHGVELNMTKGIKILERAADLGWSPALNTLGWYAMNEERNHTKALQYFQRAYKLKNPDAAFNLGHMHMSGKLPKGSTDKYSAYTYYQDGAHWGQIESMFWLAMYKMRGHPKAGDRNVDMALSWARYVSEKNPFVTHLLAEGLKHYKDHQWELSLFYYGLAAESGSEVGHFNLAYICELDYEEIGGIFEEECVYRHYNLSIQRLPHQVHPHAWIKMADYYTERGDTEMAATLYTAAAKAGFPQAYYSLSLLVASVYDNKNMESLWKDLDITKNHPRVMQTELLHRCQESNDAEAFVVCSVPLLILYAEDLYHGYGLLLLVVSMATSTIVIWQLVLHNQQQVPAAAVPAV